MEKKIDNVCSVCCKKFTAKKNLLKHLRDVHKNFKEAERMVVKKIKCPELNCGYMCRMMKELRDHIEISHKIHILKDILQFSDEIVFQKWKKEEESSTVSWFVTGRKKTTLTDGTKKQTLYCHRSGHYSPKGLGKYRMRSMGSCKIGVTCPASMEVTESPRGQLTVVYYKTHLGHRQDVVYLKLSREERENLADKIKQGFTFDSILEDVKESIDMKNLQKKRIHMLSKKDLYSIVRSSNISQGKILKKGTTTQNKTEQVAQAIEIGSSSGNFILKDLEAQKLSSNVHQNFTLYPGQGIILPTECSVRNETPLLKVSTFPPMTNNGLSPQIFILSRDIDCTSIAEIILLPAGETDFQSRILSNNKITTTEASDDPTYVPSQLTLEESNKVNKSNLRIQLKEKIDRIADLLPQTEYLTPKQFDLIGGKLDAVLSMFNIADNKAKMRAKKKNSRTLAKSSGIVEDVT